MMRPYRKKRLVHIVLLDCIRAVSSLRHVLNYFRNALAHHARRGEHAVFDGQQMQLCTRFAELENKIVRQ